MGHTGICTKTQKSLGYESRIIKRIWSTKCVVKWRFWQIQISADAADHRQNLKALHILSRTDNTVQENHGIVSKCQRKNLVCHSHRHQSLGEHNAEIFVCKGCKNVTLSKHTAHQNSASQNFEKKMISEPAVCLKYSGVVCSQRSD